MTPAPPSPPITCPKCGAEVGSEAGWCLNCGAAARTRLARTPNWRTPAAALLAVVLIAGGALAVAFAALTDDNGRGVPPVPVETTPAAQPPAPAPAPAPAPVATQPPATTQPPAATPPPAATQPPASTTPPPGTPAPADPNTEDPDAPTPPPGSDDGG